MNIIEFIELIDPFIIQLLIVPILVIGLGLLTSIVAKKVLVAPLITLLLNLLYETWYVNHYYPESEISYTSWNIIFPVISLVISLAVLTVMPQKSKVDKTT